MQQSTENVDSLNFEFIFNGDPGDSFTLNKSLQVSKGQTNIIDKTSLLMTSTGPSKLITFTPDKGPIANYRFEVYTDKFSINGVGNAKPHMIAFSSTSTIPKLEIEADKHILESVSKVLIIFNLEQEDGVAFKEIDLNAGDHTRYTNIGRLVALFNKENEGKNIKIVSHEFEPQPQKLVVELDGISFKYQDTITIKVPENAVYIPNFYKKSKDKELSLYNMSKISILHFEKGFDESDNYNVQGARTWQSSTELF